jgi:hypothetical protein
VTQPRIPARISLEEVFRRAAEDQGFSAEFLERPVEAARSIGASLTPGEKGLLEIMSPSELRGAIERGGLEEVELRLHLPPRESILSPGSIVIILMIVAVLASVAGPMISSGGGHSRVSETRSIMVNLKSALVSFSNDLGKYPFVGETITPDGVDAATDLVFGQTVESNILMDVKGGREVLGSRPMGMDPAVFAKRWKGPYLDSDPKEFSCDAWGTRIRYLYHEKAIYLHSAGADETFDAIGQAKAQNYEGDDIVLSVARVKF